MPFKIVDQIGVGLGFNTEPVRIKLLTDYIYKKCNERGKSYLAEEEIFEFCKEHEFEYDDEVIQLIINGLTKIVPVASPYYTIPKIYAMEKYIENFCLDLTDTKPLIHDSYDPDKIKDVFPDISDEQLEAAYMLINNSLSIITGRPGSGKTTVVTCASTMLTDCVTFLGPTGTSVQNIEIAISQLSKVKNIRNTECRTIHSFITSHHKTKKGDNTEKRNNPNPQEPDYHTPHTFIIDEMSMVPLDLFYDLILILQQYHKYRITLLGDSDQLPSINGGKIFYDMITYSKIPRTSLKSVKRTNLKGIIENAKLVIQGLDIQPDQQSVVLLNTQTKDDIDKTIQGLFKKFPKIDVHNSCILIPQKKGEISTRIYNRQLQNHYNSKGDSICKNKYYEFRVGDKLINKKNNYDIGIYNGSILTSREYSYKILVKDFGDLRYRLMINNIDRGLHIIKNKTLDLPKRSGTEYNHQFKCMYHPHEDDLEMGTDVSIHKDQLKNLELGYSITIHSAQGKGYEYVIIVLNKQMCRMLLTRKLLYTAITRAKRKCIIISDTESLEYCKAIDKLRITNLFQNHMGKIDQVNYLVDTIPRNLIDPQIKQIVNTISHLNNKRIYKSKLTLDDLSLKTYDNIIYGILCKSPAISTLFDRLQRIEYYEDVIVYEDIYDGIDEEFDEEFDGDFNPELDEGLGKEDIEVDIDVIEI